MAALMPQACSALVGQSRTGRLNRSLRGGDIGSAGPRVHFVSGHSDGRLLSRVLTGAAVRVRLMK